MKTTHWYRYAALMASAALFLLFAGCGGGGGGESAPAETKYTSTYEGLPLYAENMAAASYALTGITDARFNALPEADQRLVADKLLTTLYFGLPLESMEAMIASGTFVSSVREMMDADVNDLATADARLNDGEDFDFSDWPAGASEIGKILARFYVLESLDKNYVAYWSAYVLASTIMFSPAFELESSHNPNIERIYGALVRGIREEQTMRYSTFLHMISDDNWRRFRSPEDNGREMMEIFLLDFNDKHVPLAGQALKNWHLDRDNDTLVVGLDENRDPVSLFGTTVTNGYDFYRELAKSSEFIPGVTARLVDVYFPTFAASAKKTIVNTLVASNPATWQDLLLQIVFSEKYLFESDRSKSDEELFFSLSKKLHFVHNQNFFNYLAGDLNDMNQASMKYKLGKSVEVPLDSQSFITYHKSIRERVMIRYTTSWAAGWETETLLPDTLFGDFAPYEQLGMTEHLIDYLFLSTVARYPDAEERQLFIDAMIDDEELFNYPFRLFRDDGKLDERRNAAVAVLDYLSRLGELYRYAKVTQ